MKNLLAMSRRMLWRDWRGGELTILAIGLIIAVTSITAVGFFTDRIERGLKQQSAELIGADLVISSSRQNVSDHIEAARAQCVERIRRQVHEDLVGLDGPGQTSRRMRLNGVGQAPCDVTSPPRA